MTTDQSWLLEGLEGECTNCSGNSTPLYVEMDCSEQWAGPGILGSPYFQGVVTVMYCTIFLVALLGNGAVCFIVRAFPRMRTVTNYFIANLALGDILMTLFCVPFSFMSQLVLNHWPFGATLCRLVNYSQAVSVLVSAYTLVALAADRCRAITRPLRPRLSKPAAQGAIAAVWAGALATAAPIPLVSILARPTPWHEACQRNICREEWPHPEQSYYYSMALMALQFVVPLAVLVSTYTRIAIAVWGERPPGEAENSRDKRMAKSKRKMIKMMVTVVIVFTVCWLPLNILIILWSINVNDTSWDTWAPLPYVWFAFHWLAMSHSCYNPIIYCYMNARFRYGFIQVAAKVPCLRGCLGSAAHRAARADLHNGVSGINMTETSLHRVNTCTTYISLRRRAVRCSCSPSLRATSPNCSPRSICSRSTCSPSKSTCSSALGTISPAKGSRHSIPDQCLHSRSNYVNSCGAENCINRRGAKTSTETFLPIPEISIQNNSDNCERKNSRTSLSPNSCIQESLAHGRGTCHTATTFNRSFSTRRNASDEAVQGGRISPRDVGSPARAASLLTPQGTVSVSDRRHVKYMEDQL